MPKANRLRSLAQTFKRANSVDDGHEVELQAVLVASDAIEAGNGVIRPQNDGVEIAGYRLQLFQTCRNPRQYPQFPISLPRKPGLRILSRVSYWFTCTTLAGGKPLNQVAEALEYAPMFSA